MVAHHLFSRDMVDRIPDHCTYFATSWLIYFILPTVVAFAIMALVKDSSFVKAMDNSSGKSSKPVLGYNAQGQPVREGDGGAIAHRTWDEYANSK